MILTGRNNKPIHFNNTHIVAITVAEDTVNGTIGAKTCIHCIGHSFFVMEPIEEVYYQIHSETMDEKYLVKYGLLKPPEPYIQSNQASFTEPSRRRPTPKARQ